MQDKPGEAVKLMRRGIAIKERNLPPDHPTLPSSLNNLAEFLKAQVRLVARPIPKTREDFCCCFQRVHRWQKPACKLRVCWAYISLGRRGSNKEEAPSR